MHLAGDLNLPIHRLIIPHTDTNSYVEESRLFSKCSIHVGGSGTHKRADLFVPSLKAMGQLIPLNTNLVKTKSDQLPTINVISSLL
jgi:hypothetical protein